jgi:hypothetical protein
VYSNKCGRDGKERIEFWEIEEKILGTWKIKRNARNGGLL